jgi:hypothetical protein
MTVETKTESKPIGSRAAGTFSYALQVDPERRQKQGSAERSHLKQTLVAIYRPVCGLTLLHGIPVAKYCTGRFTRRIQTVVLKGGKAHVVDNLCHSLSIVAAWNGQQLHRWRVYPHIALVGARRIDNQHYQRA